MRRGDAVARRGEAQRLLVVATLLTAVLLFVASRELRPLREAPHRSGARRAGRGFDAERLAPAPLVAIADLHGDLQNALMSLQLRHAHARLRCASRSRRAT